MSLVCHGINQKGNETEIKFSLFIQSALSTKYAHQSVLHVVKHFMCVYNACMMMYPTGQLRTERGRCTVLIFALHLRTE